jgi:hypothetical protein
MRVTLTSRITTPAAPKIRTIKCKNWHDVTTACDELGSAASRWVFRGQADAKWSLVHSLERYFGKRWHEWRRSPLWDRVCVLRRIEGQLAYDFAAKACLFGLDASLDRPVALLSAMQHFGVPTRLLDWTYSSYLALYFALADDPPEAAECAAIWGIDLGAIHRAATIQTLPKKQLSVSKTLILSPVQFLDFSDDLLFKRYVLPDLGEYHRTMLLGEPDLNTVVPVIPRQHNNRLSAQQGLFLCPSRIGPSLLDQLALLMQDSQHGWIVKIVVPRSLQAEILRRLLAMNIHALALFPGLDGLGRFCKHKVDLWGLS